jgi:hypothetical protein
MVVKMVVRPIAKLSESFYQVPGWCIAVFSDAPSMTPYACRSARSPRQRSVNALGQMQNGSCLDLRAKLVSGLRVDIDGFRTRLIHDALVHESLAAPDPRAAGHHL